MDSKAIEHELNFWKGFVQTERFLVGWCGHHKTPELREQVADFILSVPHHKVLDVGSGVVSILNGLIPKENITTADPLGDHYKTIFDYQSHGMKPRWRTGPKKSLLKTSLISFISAMRWTTHRIRRLHLPHS